MGRSTEAVLVPAALRINSDSPLAELIRPADVDDWLDEIVTKNGWSSDPNEVAEFSYKKATIFCGIIKKDNVKIYVVNEHEHPNGGGEAFTAFSESYGDLVVLREDLDIKHHIEEDVIVQTTS